MAKNYKPVEYASSKFESRKYHKKQYFSHLTEGISSIHFRSESLNQYDSPGLLSYSVSGSHYNFLNNILFDSASYLGYNKIFKNKFHPSGSVIYIPQQYYGEEIKPNSFRLDDVSTGTAISIRDDGNGNLYSTNAINSRSNASSISSSENYVGNIQYQMGIATITETGSWSGSGASSTDIKYTDIGNGTFKINFDATHTIHQNSVVCRINKNEFTATSNVTLWSGSHNLITNVSRSLVDWTPYATSIAFYDNTPDVLGRFAETDSRLNIIPGENVILWPDNYTAIDDLVPAGIYSIIMPSGEEVFRNNLGVWTTDPESTDSNFNESYLIPNQTYRIFSNQASAFVWELKGSQIEQRGVPLIVGHFPRPVKIDKESDLTIIIRYDI